MEDLDPGDEDYYWKVEDFGNQSESLESNGKLNWIWRKGVNLGKQILVTGAVVSSVTFALPPLVALSTIGITLSVPAGFVLVTYACGEKLMSFLLPMPSAPPFEQYKLMSSDEEEYKVYRDDVGFDKMYEDHEDMEAEGEEYGQDNQNGLEMRIQLFEESNKEIDGYDQVHYSKDEIDNRLESEILEGECEEDVEVYMEDEEQPLDSKAILDILEGINEAENEISLMEQKGIKIPRDSLRAVVVEAELGGEDESNVEQLIEDMAFLPQREVLQENDYWENLAGIEESELESETTTLFEEMRDMGEIGQKREDSLAEETPEQSDVSGSVSQKDVSQDMGLKDLDVIPEDNEPPMDDKGVINGLDNEGNSDYLTFEEDETSGLIYDEPASTVENQLVVNVRIDGDHTVTDILQADKIDTSMLSSEDTMKMADESGLDTCNNGSMTPDVNINSLDKKPEDAGTMADENGFELPNNGHIAPDVVVDSFGMMPEGQEASLNNVVEVTVDYHEVVIESAMPLSEDAKKAPGQETAVGSDKVKLEEEKVWEQINAMRTIVGYIDTPHTSYAEELKALYVFTGVEPPVSSKDPADLAYINEKLQFLMSIVGVK